jgi:hypothetical protein
MSFLVTAAFNLDSEVKNRMLEMTSTQEAYRGFAESSLKRSTRWKRTQK